MSTTNPHDGDQFLNYNAGNQWIGFQGNIYDSVIYQTPTTPQHKYQLGVSFLRMGESDKARDLITEAIEEGYDSPQVRFHWVLAILSGRVLDQITDDDMSALADAISLCRDDSDWARGIRLVTRLLTFTMTVGDGQSSGNTQRSHDDLDSLVIQLEALPEYHNIAIRRHMELLLDGAIHDRLHVKERQEVEKARNANARKGRLWKFFEPKPQPPRHYVPAKPLWGPATYVGIVVASASSLLGVAWLATLLSGWQSMLAAAVTGVGAILAARYGTRWIRATDCRRLLDRRYAPRSPYAYISPDGYVASARTTAGFAAEVSALFEEYTREYAPIDSTHWRWATSAARQWFRNEIVRVYRETRVQASEIKWLVRHRIEQLRRHYVEGTLWEYRQRFRVPQTTMFATFAGTAIGIAGGLTLVVLAITSAPFSGIIATLLIVAGAVPAAIGILRILRAKWLYQFKQQDRKERSDQDFEAYDRWREVLADRPTDEEVAAWLDADRRYLKHRAMEVYNLAARDVIAHSFTVAPAKPYRKMQTAPGLPTWYSRYRVTVYLLTAAGLRQMTAELDFETGTFSKVRRRSFRYDAVASIEVRGLAQRRAKLALVNGEHTEVKVSEEGSENSLDASDLALTADPVESGGLASTLHILEGIAAEGKEWIARQKERQRAKVARLRQRLDGAA